MHQPPSPPDHPLQACPLQDHNRIFKSFGFKGNRDSKLLPKVVRNLEAEALGSLTPRELDVLFFMMIVKRISAPQDSIIVHDLFHSLGRLAGQSPFVDRLPTVCPHSSMFVHGAQHCRPIVPPELFSAMGLDFGELGIEVDIADWHWEAFVDMLGNAFDGHSLLAVALIAFAHA